MKKCKSGTLSKNSEPVRRSFHIPETFVLYSEQVASPLAELNYDNAALDFVRFREDALDDTIAAIVAEVVASGDSHAFRQSLVDGDTDLLTTFARRRIVAAHRTLSHDALMSAFDAYALLPVLSDVELGAWFKGGLLVARASELDRDVLFERFADIAPPLSVELAGVIFKSTDRLDHFSQCFLVETSTSHGAGLLNTAVARDDLLAPDMTATWGGAPEPQPFRSGYTTAGAIASLAATLADAFDALEGHVTDPIRHDQLVASSFDIVTGGSFLRSRACVGFFVNGPDGLDFSVVVADIDANLTRLTAVELAEVADSIVDQAATAHESVLVLLTVVPNFDDLYGDADTADAEDFDDDDDDGVNEDPLGHYLPMIDALLTAEQ